MAYQDGRGFYAEDNRIGYHGRLWSVHFQLQWIEWLCFWAYNWHNFSLITCAVEYDPMGPSFEIECAVLGFWWRVAFALPWTTESSRMLAERMDEINLDPDFDLGSLMLPIEELRKLRLGTIDAHVFTHAGETYHVIKKPE